MVEVPNPLAAPMKDEWTHLPRLPQPFMLRPLIFDRRLDLEHIV